MFPPFFFHISTCIRFKEMTSADCFDWSCSSIPQHYLMMTNLFENATMMKVMLCASFALKL